MHYLALARKWRPRNFTQLVGQDHVTKVIINSLNKNHLHHAYLFTGTRGVGKTSIARLLAKALNCEQGVSSEPCLNCHACKNIEQGCFIDLIEIDAASKTRVEDTRELLENVPYLPAQGRYKIFLIDEIHMLSQHSFNALLKTLEEPPKHVKFLLATTDPQKLPATVLSRCLQFHLNALSLEIMTQHLTNVMHAEKYLFAPKALELIAKAARGSMRDALGLLEKALAVSKQNNLSATEVKTILGYTQKDYTFELLQALTNLDAHQLIIISRQIANEGGQFNYVMDELLRTLHEIILIQNLPVDDPLLTYNEELKALAARLTPEDTQLFYQIGIKGNADMDLAPTIAIGFEMTLLRMLAFKPAQPAENPSLAYKFANKNITNITVKEELILSPSPQPNTLPKEESGSVLNLNSEAMAKVEITNKNWPEIIKDLQLTGPTLNAAKNINFVKQIGNELTFSAAIGHQALFTTNVKTRLETALTNFYSQPISLLLEFNKADALVEKQKIDPIFKDDPIFLQIQQELNAEPIKKTDY